MEELLTKWSELEPNFCQASSSEPGCYYVGGDQNWNYVDPTNLYIPNIWLNTGKIFTAIAEALQTKGWEWELSGNTIDDEPIDDELVESIFFYHAEILRKENWTTAQGNSPVEALLVAYLDALEAEKKEASKD